MNMVDTAFDGNEGVFDSIEIISNINAEDVNRRLQEILDVNNSSISIVKTK